MKKNVWIINHYATNTYFDRGGRHYNFAKYLKRAGYEPVIFCASTVHSTDKNIDTAGRLFAEKNDSVCPYVFVAARSYRGNGKQRILNMIDFYRNVKKAAKAYAKQYGAPEVIYASSPHPLTLLAGEELAKHFGVKCVCEVRDLWPESIVNSLEQYTKEDLLIRILYKGERWIYKRADALIFTIEGGKQYLIHQGWDDAHGGPVSLGKVSYINNGVDAEVFYQNQAENVIEDPDLEDQSTFKAIYTGSIRISNGIDLLIGCAEKLKEVPQIKLLVYGGGEELDTLKQECAGKGLTNIVFKGAVPKGNIPYILSKANITLLNYAVSELANYRYGCSQNKLFEYFAAQRPILSNLSMEYDLIRKYHCGYSEKVITTSNEYAEAILKLYNLPQKAYQTLCENSKKAAEDYDFRNLTKKLIDVLEKA